MEGLTLRGIIRGFMWARQKGALSRSLLQTDNDNDPVAEDGMRWDEGEREREEEKR